MKYFTAKGDTGTTTLFNCPQGARLSKGDAVFETLGALDELNCMVGLCRSVVERSGFSALDAHGRSDFLKTLFSIQEDLFVIQAEIAGATPRLSPVKVGALEAAIERLSRMFPEVHSFVIPGATELGARLDIARAVARRVERRYVKQNGTTDASLIGAYLNRLSSLLYCLARCANHIQSAPEEKPSYQ